MVDVKGDKILSVITTLASGNLLETKPQYLMDETVLLRTLKVFNLLLKAENLVRPRSILLLKLKDMLLP